MTEFLYVIRITGNPVDGEEPTPSGVLSSLTNFDSRLGEEFDVMCIPATADSFGRIIHHFDGAATEMAEKPDRFFIIEHQARGVLQTKLTDSGKPSFAWSTPRGSEGDARYKNLRSAIADIQEMSGLPKGCVVRRAPEGNEVNWQIVWPVQSH